MPSDIEYFVANISGGVKRRTLRGRAFLVAPVKMLLPGVHTGSRGSLFYSAKVIANSLRGWNGMPLTLKHPKVPGSARNADVIEAQGIGTVFNTTVEGDVLNAEAWFDIENTNDLDPTLISDIENGTAIPVSTGLFSATTQKDGVFNGTTYTGEVDGIQPDHLAVLREEEGACSLDDGCGINNSEKEESTMALSVERKKEAVDSLIANCDCYKEADRETLNSFDDNEIVEEVMKQNANMLIANSKTAAESIKALQAPIEIDEKTSMVFNTKTEAWEKKVKEEEVKIENSAPKKLSEAEWLAAAPESIRNSFAHSQSVIENERQDIIGELVANVEEDDVENAREDLATKSLDELKTISRFSSKKEAAPASSPSYEGRGSFTANRGSKVEFDTKDTIPVLDFFAADKETA